MTSIADCISRAVDFGAMDRARGLALQTEYDQLVARYSAAMAPTQAAVAAARDLREANRARTARRRHHVLNQLRAMRKLRHDIETAADPAAALKSLLEFNPLSGNRSASVRSLAEAYETSINAALREVLEATGTNVMSRSRDPALLTALIRELHGEATGNARAGAMAAAVRGQQQRMRRLFNAHGGDIGELADYGVPHAHDANELTRRGFDTWAEAIRPLLAWDRIPNLDTGRPFAAAPGLMPPMADVRKFLDEVYSGITTRGWDSRDPAMTPGGKALANMRADHRVLHFRDGSAWLDYNRAFGTSDPFSAMIDGLHGLANDVAMMQVLGPNPRMGLEFAAQVARKRAADPGNPGLAARVSRAEARAKAMMAHQDGSANRAEHVAWARFFSGTRALLVANQLGSAVLSSVTDAATIHMAARTMGMARRNVMARSVQLMASGARRDTAARMGYVAEVLADTGGSQSRFMGQTMATGIPETLSNFTLRATGLAFVTDMRRIAFQIEFSGWLAENAALDFAALPKPLRKVFSDRGIAPADWDLLRDPATRFSAPNGGDFITPFHWLEHQTALPRIEAEGLAMRLQMAIREQLELAVPSASLEGRAMMQGAAAPGSIPGEIARSFMMYKSFGVSLMLGQYRRFAGADSWGFNRWGYAAKASALLLVLGGLAIQLKELAKGNDPRPMDEPKFWIAALFQGGGLGIFGDFFNAETSRVGGGIAETVAGPVIGLGSDILKPVASNAMRALAGERTALGRDLAGFTARNTPFLSSAFYARTAYSRLVSENVAAFLDPENDLVMRRRLKRQAREYGTRPWWTPGDALPHRPPALSNAIGGRP